jgi:hypothetical protein
MPAPIQKILSANWCFANVSFPLSLRLSIGSSGIICNPAWKLCKYPFFPTCMWLVYMWVFQVRFFYNIHKAAHLLKRIGVWIPPLTRLLWCRSCTMILRLKNCHCHIYNSSAAILQYVRVNRGVAVQSVICMFMFYIIASNLVDAGNIEARMVLLHFKL